MQQFDAIFKIFGRAVFEVADLESQNDENFLMKTYEIRRNSKFGLSDLKNGSAKYFKNCIKLLHFFQGLIWRIYCWGLRNWFKYFFQTCVMQHSVKGNRQIKSTEISSKKSTVAIFQSVALSFRIIFSRWKPLGH